MFFNVNETDFAVFRAWNEKIILLRSAASVWQTLHLVQILLTFSRTDLNLKVNSIFEYMKTLGRWIEKRKIHRNSRKLQVWIWFVWNDWFSFSFLTTKRESIYLTKSLQMPVQTSLKWSVWTGACTKRST